MTYVALSDLVVKEKTFRGQNKLQRLLAWVAKEQPRIFAIDAPSGRNLGRTTVSDVRQQRGWQEHQKYLNMRLCEAELASRGIQLYATPQEATSAQEWVRTGWRIYRALRRNHNYSTLKAAGLVSVPRRPTLVEVHPHASFVVGLGWIPRNKRFLSGQLERAAYLLRAAKWNGHRMTGEPLPARTMLSQISQEINEATWSKILRAGIALEKSDHNILDTLAGLVTIIRVFEGKAVALGDPSEGLIVVPEQPKPAYSGPA